MPEMKKNGIHDTRYVYHKLPESGWTLWTYVKDSNLPNAGKGLFAARRFSPGDIIGKYTGVYLNANNVTNTTYVLRARGTNRKFKYINGKNGTTGFVQYVNDALLENRNNCYFSEYGNLRAYRNILPNQELYVSYGNEYWKTRQIPK